MMLARHEGRLQRATPGGRGVCPHCDEPVMAKCGQIMVWHWSHYADYCSDTWAEESDWHLTWKDWALERGWQVEVPIVKNEKPHRADIVTPSGWIIELQHSPLSTTQIDERERFYGRMVWIWDAASAWDRFVFNDHDWGVGVRWKRPRWSLCYVKRPLYLDFADGDVLRVKLSRKESRYGDYDVCLGRGAWVDPDVDFPKAYGAGQTRLIV